MYSDPWTSVDESSCWKYLRTKPCLDDSHDKKMQKRIHLSKKPKDGKQYALSSQLRRFMKIYFKKDFTRATVSDMVIHPFFGDENTVAAEKWLTDFLTWAFQEHLTGTQKAKYAIGFVFGDAFNWCRSMQLEYATWTEFYNLFGEKYMGKILKWPGSHIYPYFLHFFGAAHEDKAGQAAIEAVLTTPSLEHDFGHLSKRLDHDPSHSSHLAEFEALISGLEVALQYGVKHILACGHSKKVHDHVKGTWRVGDSAMRKCLLNVQNLVKQFDSFEILCCDAARQNNNTGATTKVARHHMETVLSGKPNAISYPGSQFRFLSLARSPLRTQVESRIRRE